MKIKISDIIGRTLVLLWVAFTVFAIGWIIAASFSTTKEIFVGGVLKTGLHFDNYARVFKNHNILNYFKNSLLYTVVGCVGVILVAAPASYVLANYAFKGRKLIQTAYISTMGIPGIMLMIPLFMIVSRLNLNKNTFILMFIYICISAPFTIFYLSSFFSSIPVTIQESALVEGCSHSQAFWKVVFPIAQPGIITVTIFNFIGLWNEYLWALIFANTGETRTLALGLQAIVDSMRYSGDYAGLFAAVVIVFVPTFILFIVLSEKIMGGMTSGAVKG